MWIILVLSSIAWNKKSNLQTSPLPVNTPQMCSIIILAKQISTFISTRRYNSTYGIFVDFVFDPFDNANFFEHHFMKTV